jgi:hypothetical protein
MTHLTRDELTRFRRGETGDRERIVAHLAACDECGALYGEVLDAEPPEPAVVSPALVARGRRAFRAGRRRGDARLWRFAVPLAAAAAAVVVALLLPRAREAAPPDPAAGLRGAGLQALAPAGEVAALDFRWTSALHPASFAVEVREPGAAVVLREVVAGESWQPSAAERAAIVAGRAYEWRVVALDAAGEPLTASSWQRFVVVPGD